MRIAYVYDAVYPWVPGGVQRRVAELGRRLGREHDVHWFGCHYWDGPSVVERDGVTLHGVAPARPLYVDGRRSVRGALSFTAGLLKPLAAERFDVVDCQEFPYFPAFACRAATLRHGTPLVVTWHEVWGDYWEEYLGRLGPFGRLVERGVAHLPATHVAVSHRTRDDLAALTGASAALVPNGIDVDAVRRTAAADDRVDVCYAGRLTAEKNVGLLVEAVALLAADDPDVRCRIVGEGPDAARLRRLVSARGLDAQVELVGFLPDATDVYALMKAADTFVLPSRREGFGIVAVEALACGTPVVTVREPLNAAVDLVDDGVTGAVCDPTPEAVAAAIGRARACSPRACRTAAARYDWDVVAERTLEVYEAAVGERAKSGRAV